MTGQCSSDIGDEASSGSSKPGEEISKEKSLFWEKTTFFYLPVQAAIILSQFINAASRWSASTKIFDVVAWSDLYFNQEVFRIRIDQCH